MAGSTLLGRLTGKPAPPASESPDRANVVTVFSKQATAETVAMPKLDAALAELVRPAALAELEATKPTPKPTLEAKPNAEGKLDELLNRINGLQKKVESPSDIAATVADSAPAIPATPGVGFDPASWFPIEPTSFADASLTSSEVEALLLKLLLARGDASGRQMADHVRLPFILVDQLLSQLKHERWVVHKSAAPMNDYLYTLTDIGREKARRLTEVCTYFGTAPVALKDYIDSVGKQSLTAQHPTVTDLERAFDDLQVNPAMLRRLGPAINSARGLFLYGAAGNGKTSIAERVTKAFGQFIWIPRAVGVDGEIIRLFDPSSHEEAPLAESDGLLEEHHIDKRWVRIRRPTIVVGGELTMDNLEITLNTTTGISEAPLQLKSNCGTLVIDDFGRQKMSTDQLLNRWIVPLEKRYDFLNLASGKKIQVPFDQLIIFSTNLQPRDLCDDAFLRRIPYKIEVHDPTEDEFRSLLKIMAPKLGFAYSQAAADHLISTHYTPRNRPFRCCQPRDLLQQVKNFCLYQNIPAEMTPETMDFAVENYFAIM